MPSCVPSSLVPKQLWRVSKMGLCPYPLAVCCQEDTMLLTHLPSSH